MGFLQKIFRRAEEPATEPTTDNTAIADFLFSNMRDNSTITIEDALHVPAFSACVEYISGLVASLPIKLYHESENATEEVKGDNRIKLLNDETNDLLDSFQMKKAFVRDYLIRGNGYIYINKKRNAVDGLYYVMAQNVSVMKNCDPIFKTATFMVNGKQYRNFEFLSLLRNTADGVTGRGVFEDGREVLAVAYNTQVLLHYMTENGGNKRGYLQVTKKVNEDALQVVKEKWRNHNTNRDYGALILNDGIEFKETSATSVEMQMNENIQTTNECVCALFGLSMDVITGKANSEAVSNAMKTAVQPILEAFQTALNRDLLLEIEKGNMYYAFDTTEMLKGDMLKRYQAYQIALQSNFMQIDEVRYKEDLAPIGFNYVKLGLNDVLLDVKNGVVYTPNTNKTTKIGTETLENQQTPIENSKI